MKINEKNLCVFATTPPYDIEGFLSKRGEVNKAFQRRYFVLKGNLLFYFDKRGDKEPLGLIIVEGCTIELSEEIDNYCFEMAFNGNRTYVLSADTQESMETWMKALTCAGYEYKRIIVAELQRQLEEIEDSRIKMIGNRNTVMVQSTAVPKPPPRRQNPFNRPAPPPPTGAINIQREEVLVSQLPPTNGHFATSPERHINESTSKKERNDASSSIINIHRTQRTAGRSEFFVEKLPVISSNNSHEANSTQELQRTNAMEDFARNHERFSEEVMRDINEYRVRKKPLIQI